MLKISRLFHYLLAKNFLLFEGEPGAAGGAGGAAPAGAGGAPSGPEHFSREYVTELRAENRSYRQRAQEQEQKAKAAEEKAAAAEAAAEAKITEAMATANKSATDRIVMSELRIAAIKAGMVDLDGLKLADLSAVKLNDKGEIEGADALMASLKTSKPYLFGAVGTTSHPGAPPAKKEGEPVDVRKMSKEEYAVHKKSLLKKT